MKFWKKIFLYSVILTMILINGVGVILIEKIHYSNVERTITDAIEIHKNIISTIYLNFDATVLIKTDPKVDLSDNFELILRNYVYNNNSNMENIQLYNINNKLLTSVNDYNSPSSYELLSSINGTEKVFMIKEHQGQRVLFVGSQFKINDENYKVASSKNIDYLFREKQSNYKLFIALDIFINIFLILGMYIISIYVTKPIVKLANLSVKITEGQYSERAEDINSKDEVGILAKNFNNMLESLQEKMDELEEKNVEKERFINNLTHEIKTPITSIIGYSELLLKANINDEIREKSLNYINSEGRRLESLSSTLIKLTRIKNETFELENVNLSDAIYECIAILKEKSESKYITIKFNSNILNSMIFAEKQLIIILFKNIIENSIKASKENSTIDINMYSDSNKKTIVVIKDYGVGIPKEDLNKILEPFYMVDKARDRSKNGIGLGLALCNEICSLFNIKLTVNSKVNEGTEAILTFNTEGQG